MIIQKTMKKERRRADARRIDQKKIDMLRRSALASFFERTKLTYQIESGSICSDCPHKLKPSCQITRVSEKTWQCTKQRESAIEVPSEELLLDRARFKDGSTIKMRPSDWR